MIRGPFIAGIFIGIFLNKALSNERVSDAVGTLIPIALIVFILMLTALLTWIWWNVRAGDPEIDSHNDATKSQSSYGK